MLSSVKSWKMDKQTQKFLFSQGVKKRTKSALQQLSHTTYTNINCDYYTSNPNVYLLEPPLESKASEDFDQPHSNDPIELGSRTVLHAN